LRFHGHLNILLLLSTKKTTGLNCEYFLSFSQNYERKKNNVYICFNAANNGTKIA